MSVILNEAAISKLFDTPNGPVARFVEGEAEKIVEQVKRDVDNYFVGANTGVEDDVGLRMQGSTAVIGIEDDPQLRATRGESKVRRLVRLGLVQKWLTDAVNE